ncbi:WhiB family transcriptional regulator [Rhodococcus phage Trogglehumper]|uniref:WhiB family transcriptional regulator n=1 Tax=Rhodococcus phage Trogglehumper TaxID=3038381 RepID=A0AAF0GIH9_9CAUD|nr:WhiB family transcriptional regulator [Rhodococcus phage Trogglehumper]
MDFAACLGMRPINGEGDIFFPTQGKRGLLDQGRAVCNTCPVRRECREYAEGNRERFGLWAGDFFDGGRTPNRRSSERRNP